MCMFVVSQTMTRGKKSETVEETKKHMAPMLMWEKALQFCTSCRQPHNDELITITDLQNLSTMRPKLDKLIQKCTTTLNNEVHKLI
jgi:hypothetical protein